MRSTGRPWLTLLACVAAGGVHAQAQPAGDARPGQGSPPPAEEGEPADAGWRLPPLRLSGSLSYDLRGSRAEQDGTSLSQTVTANIAVRSYIYQPWFAQVGGSLGLTSSWSSTNAGSSAFPLGGTDATAHERIRGRDQFLTGNARIDVFPLSRFPFEVHFERNDSRVDSGLASVYGHRTQNLGLSQRYRPLDGAYTLSGSYDHREQSGQLFRGKQDALIGDFSTRWKSNELSAGVSYSRARNSLDEGSRFGSLVTRHSYTPSSALSIHSTANWTRTQEEAGEAGSDISVLQGSSVALWRREGSPLTLTASARALALRDHVGGDAVDSAGLTLGASYEVNRNLRVNASGGANFNRSGSGDATAFTGSAGASYQGDGLQVAGFHYDWFGSGSAGLSLADGSLGESRQQQTLGLQLGHSLSRSFALARSQLSFTGSQSLAWAHTRSSPRHETEPGQETSRMLLNSLGATWQVGTGAQSAYARASYNDSTELGGARARFRMLNFQLSGNLQFDNRRSLVGNLTYQRSLERTGVRFDPGEIGAAGRTGSAGASGEITYTHVRPFGVAGLRFVSRLKLAQDVLKQPGTLLSLPDRETRLWENRLDWSIGRLETQLVLRLSEVDGRRWDSLTLRVQRTFGE